MVWYIEYLCREAEWVGSRRKNNEEYDKDCIQEEFQLVRSKLGRDGEGSMEIIGVGCCSIIISDGELELA